MQNEIDKYLSYNMCLLMFPRLRIKPTPFGSPLKSPPTSNAVIRRQLSYNGDFSEQIFAMLHLKTF